MTSGRSANDALAVVHAAAQEIATGDDEMVPVPLPLGSLFTVRRWRVVEMPS